MLGVGTTCSVDPQHLVGSFFHPCSDSFRFTARRRRCPSRAAARQPAQDFRPGTRNPPQRQNPRPRFSVLSFFPRARQTAQSLTPRRGVRPHDTHRPVARQSARVLTWRARLSARQATHRRRPVAVGAQQIVQIDSAVRRASSNRLRAVRFRPGLYRSRALSRQRTQQVAPSTASSPHRMHRPPARRCEIRRRLNPAFMSALHASQYRLLSPHVMLRWQMRHWRSRSEFPIGKRDPLRSRPRPARRQSARPP